MWACCCRVSWEAPTMRRPRGHFITKISLCLIPPPRRKCRASFSPTSQPNHRKKLTIKRENQVPNEQQITGTATAFPKHLSPTSISVLQNNPKSDPNKLIKLSYKHEPIPTNSTSFGHSPPPKLISCSADMFQPVQFSEARIQHSTPFISWGLLVWTPSSGCVSREGSWASTSPSESSEHAVTAAPLTDKKKNHKGGSAFPSISALISKVCCFNKIKQLKPTVLKLISEHSIPPLVIYKWRCRVDWLWVWTGLQNANFMQIRMQPIKITIFLMFS